MTTPLRLTYLTGIVLLYSLSSYIPSPSLIGVSLPQKIGQARGTGDHRALIPQAIPFPITGKAIIDVSTTIDAQVTELGSGLTADLSPIKKTAAEPRYVAIGGSLTAGVRNGGLYRQAQLTAYPNLIALQMGLKNFHQPLFDQSQGNGSGYKQLITDGTKAKYRDVTNAVAVVSQNPLTFSRYAGPVDNLGMPGMGILGATIDEQWRIDNKVAFSLPYEPTYRAYLRRLLPDDNQQWLTTYLGYVTGQQSDLCTIELGLDDAIWFAAQGGYRLGALMGHMGLYEANPMKLLLPQFSKSNTKTIVATVPDVLDLPYFKQYQVATLRKLKAGSKLYASRDDRFDYLNKDPMFVGELNDKDILLPTANVISLFESSTEVGLTKENPLTSFDVLNLEEQHSLFRIDALNAIITAEAKRYNIPIFDLKALYKTILAGTYVTEDGVKLDPTFPGGNFFSADGLTPSALGQAVLANEWIKVINQTYKTQIPLVRTNRITAQF